MSKTLLQAPRTSIDPRKINQNQKTPQLADHEIVRTEKTEIFPLGSRRRWNLGTFLFLP